MKIFNGTPGYGRLLTDDEITDFLSKTKKNLQLGTIDDKNEPNIHPVWFLYEKGLIYCATEKKSKKIKNIQNNNIVYFSIDDDNIEYKGVRGKGIARIIDDVDFNVQITEKIIIKYAGDLKSKLAKEVMDEIKNGIEVILEITPKFYSVWSFTL